MEGDDLRRHTPVELLEAEAHRLVDAAVAGQVEVCVPDLARYVASTHRGWLPRAAWVRTRFRPQPAGGEAGILDQHGE